MTTTYPTVPSVTFKPIDRFPNYCVGDDGSVWSRRVKRGKKGKLGDWHRLVSGDGRIGYRQVRLIRDDGPGVVCKVHHLVLTAFVGPCPPGLECCHNDGNPANNHVSNLRWDTRFANIHDSIRHGTFPTGERHGSAKLTAQQVAEIRARREVGETQRALARAYGVDPSSISAIIHRKLWRYTERPGDGRGGRR
jgi:hypothetical protein